MKCDRRLLLLFALLAAYELLPAESRHHRQQHHHEEEQTDLDQRHRHRHRHESSSIGRRTHQSPDRSSWSQDLGDYTDDTTTDEEEEDDGDDYGGRYYERSKPRSRNHGLDSSRYPSRYHRSGHRWHEEEEEEEERRRQVPGRYTSRRYHRAHRRNYPRNRDDLESNEESLEYGKLKRYQEDSAEKENGWWRNWRRQRLNSRTDFRLPYDRTTGRRHYQDDFEGSRLADWRRRVNESRFVGSRHERRKHEEDYEAYYVDGPDEDSLNEEEDDEDDEDEEEEEEEEDELENDFYKSEKRQPLRTYDDIIRRLTADDPTTSRPTVRRDYRNIRTDRYGGRRDPVEQQPAGRNVSRSSSRLGSTHAPNRRSMENSSVRLAGSASQYAKDVIGIVVKGTTDRQERRRQGLRIDDAMARKSLEQDYDEYLNAPDEKEEDLIKAGVEEDTGMQADVTNTDYTDDENPEENETPGTFTTTSTTSTTSTTTTTTTTPRSLVTQHYDYRDPRAYESGTGAQYNGYQGKSDYPPMSAHSVHKWQSLGTREGVKETRGNMQQYNRNGKNAEIREALQHAIKVSREGSCQWPRPRVIPVRDVYPSPSTTYIPHCAILHRCSDDTGCCRSEALTCVPKHTHRVELSFYTTNLGGSSMVEKLSFYNHTECECRERTEYEAANEKTSEQRVYRHYQPSQPQNIRKPPPRKPCRCPSEFTPRITLDGVCQCNCYENHQNCIKTRRGKGYFSLADRLCIQNEECATPSCEFGEYIKRQGKCPKKKDKFDAIVNYRTSHRYRS